jgi:hypothetical protein
MFDGYVTGHRAHRIDRLSKRLRGKKTPLPRAGRDRQDRPLFHARSEPAMGYGIFLIPLFLIRWSHPAFRLLT